MRLSQEIVAVARLGSKYKKLRLRGSMSFVLALVE